MLFDGFYKQEMVVLIFECLSACVLSVLYLYGWMPVVLCVVGNNELYITVHCMLVVCLRKNFCSSPPGNEADGDTVCPHR